MALIFGFDKTTKLQIILREPIQVCICLKKKKFSSMLGTELCSLKIHLLKSQLPVAQSVTLFGDELFKGMKLKDAFRPPFEYGVLIEYD